MEWLEVWGLFLQQKSQLLNFVGFVSYHWLVSQSNWQELSLSRSHLFKGLNSLWWRLPDEAFDVININSCTLHYVHFVKYDDAVSFYDAVSDTIRRRGGNRGIFTEEGVDTVAYFGGNHGSRVWKSLKLKKVYFPRTWTSWDKYMFNRIVFFKFWNACSVARKNILYKVHTVPGWQDLAGFRRGQKWPWNLSSSAYLQFSRQMRRFCA